MRQLVYVPIIHTAQDLGSQLDLVKQKYIARYGIRAWQRRLRVVERFWDDIAVSLCSLWQDGRKIRVYQDGMPVSGREVDLARQLAQNGSRNHQLIVQLVEKGAVLMGTEDPELLRREYDHWQTSSAVYREASAHYYDELMELRDRYIANRIDSTLREGELGLLFIGLLHGLTDKLPQDIGVISLAEVGPAGARRSRRG